MLMNSLASQNSGRAGGLYAFTSFTFTNCGVSGRYGPTLAQMQSAYSSTPWAQNTAFLNIGAYQGYQKWTVPKDGVYRFDVVGAVGGRYNTSADYRGRGARIQGDVALVKGEFIIIVVGQAGQDGYYLGNGGGGGTFVVKNSTGVPLFVAGGGGGEATRSDYRVSISDASITTNAKPAEYGPYVPGEGGAGGAGGFYSNGQANDLGSFAYGYNAGCIGGPKDNSFYGDGGFGGGSGGSNGVGDFAGGGGAGGGYSGGNYFGGSLGSNGNGGAAGYFSQGGGGSYYINTATNITTTAAYNYGHGYVIITAL